MKASQPDTLLDSAPALDPALRAIVAADRLVLSETLDGRSLLQRRLAIFYGYFALLAALAAIFGRLREFPRDFQEATVDLLRDLQSVHALVLAVVFLMLTFGVHGRRVLYTLDVGATVATAATAAIALSAVPMAVTMDVSAVAFFVLFFVVRAALVPGAPWVAAAAAGVSVLPFALGLALMYRRADPSLVPDPDAATAAAVRAMVAGVIGVYVVSRTIYGLRSAVEKAVQLGQYVIHEKIGEGGMGAVYRASHAMLKRPTAIKVIPPDRVRETTTARFEREVMATSRLTHPNTVAVYDYGRTAGGVFYYAMELLDGEDLARLVARDGPLPPERTRHVLRQITAALGEAHDEGLVHRDVKPANIMLCTRGGVPDFVKVLDFGLVKDVTATSGDQLTDERAVAGTPPYMAPESILAPETVGPATDVYAVGCVAYFLLTGRAPFQGSSAVEICAAHVHDVPDPPSTHAASVPADLDALVLRCLAKQAAERPTTRQLEVALSA